MRRDGGDIQRERDAAFSHLIDSADRRTLARLIRDVRSEKGLSQSELATKLHVFQSVISKIELAERDVSALEVRAICESLDQRVDEFFLRLDKLLSNVC